MRDPRPAGTSKVGFSLFGPTQLSESDGVDWATTTMRILLGKLSKNKLVQLIDHYTQVICMIQHGIADRSFAIESGVASGLFGLLRSAG